MPYITVLSVASNCRAALLNEAVVSKFQAPSPDLPDGAWGRTRIISLRIDYISITNFDALITLVNKILAHERFIVFLTYLFTRNPNMQSKFFHHPQFLYNGLLND